MPRPEGHDVFRPLFLILFPYLNSAMQSLLIILPNFLIILLGAVLAQKAEFDRGREDDDRRRRAVPHGRHGRDAPRRSSGRRRHEDSARRSRHARLGLPVRLPLQHLHRIRGVSEALRRGGLRASRAPHRLLGADQQHDRRGRARQGIGPHGPADRHDLPRSSGQRLAGDGTPLHRREPQAP